MKKNIVLLVSALLILALITCSKSDIGNPRVGQIQPKKKSDIPPSIRKCMTVKCAAGYYCFFGRCIQSDPLCESKKCKKGQRCVKGECLEQLHKPRKSICSPLNFKLEKQKCSKDLQQACKTQTLIQNVCGFKKKTGDYFDYTSPCLACSDLANQIDFYYAVACVDAPRVCDEDEECLNGVCSAMFVHPAFENAKSCNVNGDCDCDEMCVGHKCIEKRDLFNFLQAKSETDVILVKI